MVQGPCEKIHRIKEDDLFCTMLSLKQHMSYDRWPTAISWMTMTQKRRNTPPTYWLRITQKSEL